MTNEYIVHTIEKVHIFVHELSHMHGDAEKRKVFKYFAQVYRGGTHLHTTYGETYDETLDKAAAWAHEKFDIPVSIEIRDELPEKLLMYEKVHMR